jgi:hypothetical protein
LDGADMPSDLAAYLADDSRAQPIFTMRKSTSAMGKRVTAAGAFLALKRAKEAVADPNTIGNSTPNVVG